MIILRILTGRHAGASLELSQGKNSIGPSNCNISISDWDEPDGIINVDGDSVELTMSPTDGAQRVLELRLYSPVVIGNIAICAGKDDQKWPHDITLLSNAFRPTPKRIWNWLATESKNKRAVSVVLTVVAALIISFPVVSQYSTPLGDRPQPVDLQQTRKRLQNGLEQAGFSDLVVTARNDVIQIEGFIPSRQMEPALNDQIAALPHRPSITRSYAAIDDLSEVLRQTFSPYGLHVEHQGGGVFDISGETNDPNSVQQLLRQTRQELKPLVKEIRASVKATSQNTSVITSSPQVSRLDAETFSVIQTRDGVKHIVVTDDRPKFSARDALIIEN